MAIERQEIDVPDGTHIPVWVSGQGRALLIVPGAAANHDFWEPVREYLEPHVTLAIMNRRAILEDPLTSLDLEQEFDDVAAVAASLGDEVDLAAATTRRPKRQGELPPECLGIALQRGEADVTRVIFDAADRRLLRLQTRIRKFPRWPGLTWPKVHVFGGVPKSTATGSVMPL